MSSPVICSPFEAHSPFDHADHCRESPIFGYVGKSDVVPLSTGQEVTDLKTSSQPVAITQIRDEDQDEAAYVDKSELRSPTLRPGGIADVSTNVQHSDSLEYTRRNYSQNESIPTEPCASQLDPQPESANDGSATSSSSSPVLTPLPQPWKFPPNSLYRKSASGSTRGFSKSDIEALVTAGSIIEDDNGLRWASNRRYLLFRCLEPSNEGLKEQHTHTGHYSDAQSLFSPPSFAESHTSPALPRLGQDTHPLSPSERPRPLYVRRGIRRATRHNTLTDQPPQTTPTPLPEKWKFPALALYKEAYPRSTQNFSHTQLESAVTKGTLIADAKGLRKLGTEMYVLLYTGDRQPESKKHVPRITRGVRVLRDVCAEHVEEGVPTPIVDEKDEAGQMARERKVRFWRDMWCVNSCGWEEKKDVVDNEGKTLLEKREHTKEGVQ